MSVVLQKTDNPTHRNPSSRMAGSKVKSYFPPIYNSSSRSFFLLLKKDALTIPCRNTLSFTPVLPLALSEHRTSMPPPRPVAVLIVVPAFLTGSTGYLLPP